MTANKMPVLPEPDKSYALMNGTVINYYTEASVIADRRACYLAGIAAARECVPTNWCDPMLTGDKAVIGEPPYGCQDIEAILRGVLTNLTALEQEAKK